MTCNIWKKFGSGTCPPDTRIMIEAGKWSRMVPTCANRFDCQLIAFGKKAPNRLYLFQDVASKPNDFGSPTATQTESNFHP